MSESHFLRNSLLFIGGLVVAGWLAIEIIGVLSHIFFYLLVGAVVVGGGIYLYGRAKRSLQSGRIQRKITRRY
jgi:hypothetical protein